MLLDRQEAQRVCLERREGLLNFEAQPIESGMLGCPWRILICSVVRFNAVQDTARSSIANILDRWPCPERLAKAKGDKVYEFTMPLNMGFRRARRIIKLSRAWLGDEWDTVLDLPAISKLALTSLERYYLPAASSGDGGGHSADDFLRRCR